MALLSRRFILGGATALICAPAVLRKACAKDDNIQVLQTVAASINGAALPSSTGQIIPRALAEEVIATNRKLAPKFGYREREGSFIDPGSGITILQGYVPAAPDYIIPSYPAFEKHDHSRYSQPPGLKVRSNYLFGGNLSPQTAGTYVTQHTTLRIHASMRIVTFTHVAIPLSGRMVPAAACGLGLPIPYWAVRSTIQPLVRLSSVVARKTAHRSLIGHRVVARLKHCIGVYPITSPMSDNRRIWHIRRARVT
jgi:hypothetical protein